MDETVDMLIEIIGKLSKKALACEDEKTRMARLLGEVVIERDKLRKENEAYIKLELREADVHDAS